MKVIIIGGGPAGILAAISAARENNEVVLLEKNISLGRKLLITGKGRCNITSSIDIDEFIKNIPGNGRFLYSAFQNFSNQDIIDILEHILSSDYGFKTLVVDSIDGLDDIVVEYTLRKNKWDKMDYTGFGAKYDAKTANWNVIFNLVDSIWSQKNMCILFIGHSKIKTINEPNLPSYNAYMLNLDDKQLIYISKNFDVVSFVDIKKFASQDGNKVQTSTTEERVMHLHPHPAYLATKTRYKAMPTTLPLDWNVFVKYLSN
jgi:hypothetical protein